MATDLGLLSMAQRQTLYHHQQLQKAAMWNWTGRCPELDTSWELRALAVAADSAASAVGSAWPPRSYSCTFCAREFRSAQALGGHMNVHRRDRARLHQSSQESDCVTSPVVFSSAPVERDAGGRLGLFYPIPSSEGSPASVKTLLNLLPEKAGMGKIDTYDKRHRHDRNDEMIVDEVDTELRLGW